MIFPSFSFIPRVFSDTKDKFLQKVKITKDKATEIFSDELTLLEMKDT